MGHTVPRPYKKGVHLLTEHPRKQNRPLQRQNLFLETQKLYKRGDRPPHGQSPDPNCTGWNKNQPPLTSSEARGTRPWRHERQDARASLPEAAALMLLRPAFLLPPRLRVGSLRHGHNPSGSKKHGKTPAEAIGCISIDGPCPQKS